MPDVYNFVGNEDVSILILLSMQLRYFCDLRFGEGAQVLVSPCQRAFAEWPTSKLLIILLIIIFKK